MLSRKSLFLNLGMEDINHSTHLANQVRHMLDVSNLLGLAVIQARSPNLISLHAVFNLMMMSGINNRLKQSLTVIFFLTPFDIQHDFLSSVVPH